MNASIPSTMRAATFANSDVRVEERPVPAPVAGELLVHVRAAGINNADLMQAAGHYPAPDGWPADILGMELAGEIVAMGDDCAGFELGERVCAVVGGGAHADFAIVPAGVAMRVSAADIDMVQAGALPEAAMTAWDALVAQGQLLPEHRVLITGAAGGVGTIALQIAACAGASVVASSRHEAHDALLGELGASVVARPDDVHAHGPFDVILELVGGDGINAHLDAIVTGGRIVYIGVGGGRNVELDLLKLLQKRGIVRGSTLRSRSRTEHVSLAHIVGAQVMPLLASGSLRVPIHGSFSLDDIAEAHAEFRRGGKLGKLVLTM